MSRCDGVSYPICGQKWIRVSCPAITKARNTVRDPHHVFAMARIRVFYILVITSLQQAAEGLLPSSMSPDTQVVGCTVDAPTCSIGREACCPGAKDLTKPSWLTTILLLASDPAVRWSQVKESLSCDVVSTALGSPQRLRKLNALSPS